MRALAELIDRLPRPEIPSSLSPAEHQLVQLLIESARQQVRPYTGKFEASWLLVPFGEEVWHTTNRGREELIKGVWMNTVTVDWRVGLPNGSLLTDYRYVTLLTTIKKISFLMRSNLICGRSSPMAWGHASTGLMGIARWVILHEGRFQPETHGLRLIDQASIDWFLSEFAQGGLTRLLQIPHRTLAALYLGTHGMACPPQLLNNLFALPPSEIAPIVSWIEDQGGYKKLSSGPYKGKAMLYRAWLGSLINEHGRSFQSPIMSRFCRQFEMDFAGISLLVPTLSTTEFPSQRAMSVGDEIEGSAEESLHQITHLLSSVLDAHRHLPMLLPEPAELSLRRARNLAQRFTRADGHTPFMPINTGLAYLNAAMRFVHLYGEALVDLYLEVVSCTQGQGGNLIDAQNRALLQHIGLGCVATGEPIATVLNITQFSLSGLRTSRDFKRLRLNPTLHEALRVLIGSCIVCMAILKPSREEELTHLKRNCLHHDHNGYWLNFLLGKSNIKGGAAWQEEDRPIPVLTARAVQLLQRLGARLSDIFGDTTKQANCLFYVPRMDGLGVLKANNDLLSDLLDDFCDFVGLAPDSEGRRWYVRIHEMRKWFLLLLFWSGRFDVLDAARWIAGHTDAAHIYAYIENEFPGETLPQIEAQYSEERLRRLAHGLSGAEDGADALYEAVLRHFNVESLVMVPDAEWTGYVRALREAEQFHLEPHSIRDQEGLVIGINVSFVMREIL